MSCYYPMVARPNGKTESGKTAYKITGKFYGVKRFDEVVLPCGQCIGCRLDKSRSWANRMMMELKYHQSAFFITLTYDDEHLPMTYYHTDDDGVIDEAYQVGTLVKSDLQKFMKRLRRYQEYHYGNKDVMFYACGEYGSHTHRPHYHLIVYDVIFDDLKKFGRSRAGNFQYYSSETLSKLWPYGFHGISYVSWETCAYVARYVTKKLYGDAADFYDYFNIVPEFSAMSTKPAIGLRYYEEHKEDIYEFDKLIFSTPQGNVNCRPPAYFDRKYDIEYPEQMQDIKLVRKRSAQLSVDAILNDKYMEYTMVLDNKRLYKEHSAKSLRRNLE